MQTVSEKPQTWTGDTIRALLEKLKSVPTESECAGRIGAAESAVAHQEALQGQHQGSATAVEKAQANLASVKAAWKFSPERRHDLLVELKPQIEAALAYRYSEEFRKAWTELHECRNNGTLTPETFQRLREVESIDSADGQLRGAWQLVKPEMAGLLPESFTARRKMIEAALTAGRQLCASLLLTEAERAQIQPIIDRMEALSAEFTKAAVDAPWHRLVELASKHIEPQAAPVVETMPALGNKLPVRKSEEAHA